MTWPERAVSTAAWMVGYSLGTCSVVETPRGSAAGLMGSAGARPGLITCGGDPPQPPKNSSTNTALSRIQQERADTNPECVGVVIGVLRCSPDTQQPLALLVRAVRNGWLIRGLRAMIPGSWRFVKGQVHLWHGMGAWTIEWKLLH